MRHSSTVPPDRIDTILAALKECSLSKDLETGKAVHAQAKAWKLSSNRYVTSGLINMYAQCGSMLDAQKVFNANSLHKDVVSWTCLIRGYVNNGESQQALELFESMDCPPNSRTYVAALVACASMGAKHPSRTWLEKGRSLHQSAAMNHCCDIFVESTLVDMYGKCGSMAEARSVFENMARRDAVSWTALVKGYVENGESHLGLQVFEEMVADGSVKPDARAYVAALKACVSMVSREGEKSGYWLKRGRSIHSQAVSDGCCNMFVESALVEFYAKCHCMDDARCVFERMKHRDSISWTALLQGYVENGESKVALELYDSMDVAPDARTYVVSLAACSHMAVKETEERYAWLLKAKEIHSQAVLRGECNLFVENAILEVLVKVGNMKEARDVFDKMTNRDVVSWTTLFKGYVDKGESELAILLFDSMDQSEECYKLDARIYVAALTACTHLGLSRNLDKAEKRRWLEKGKTIHAQAVSKRCCDIFLESSLVDMYSKFGQMLEARFVFDNMCERNVVAWNSLVRGYVDNGESALALEMICHMDCLGVERDSATYAAALMACGSLMASELGQSFHTEIRSSSFDKDTLLATCLVDFYGKCGDMESAQKIFDCIADKSLVTWNSLMCGYGLQGRTERVFELFEEMRKHGLHPDEISFVCVLTACSHAGLADQGRELFDVMEKRYGVRPTIEHYACLVDLLGRANYLDEAFETIRRMPFEPDSVIWSTLLGACRKCNDVEKAKVAYECLLKLDQENISAYVLMANIYKSVGMWGFRSKMKQ